MKKGSITVFLSLILTLLFSFLLTTLEAARIRGATAYATMITDLAGESALASYYYPLFQNYRLFGINSGDENGFFSEEVLLDEIRKDAVCGLEKQTGGLLRFENTTVELSGYRTMLSEGEREFLTQIRQQAVLDGASLLLEELFSGEQLEEAGIVGEVYQRQEEALEATANVTKEVLRLMEQVDGIKMNRTGISFDSEGRMQANTAFVKQIAPMEMRAIRESYGNEEVYLTVADRFFRVDKAAEQVIDYLETITELNKKIAESEKKLAEYQKNLEALGIQIKAETERLQQSQNPDSSALLQMQKSATELSMAAEKEQEALEEYQKQKKALLEVAEKEYKFIAQKIGEVIKVINQALDTVKEVKEKQQSAKLSVGVYETFLKGLEEKLSKEVYSVFAKELNRMKLYAGLEKEGFSVATIQQSLLQNYRILTGFTLKGFSTEYLGRIGEEMNAIAEGMKSYTTRGLWFTYGDIVVAENTWENVMGALGELLTTGILSFVGITGEEVSDCELNGKDLPSAGLEENSLLGELLSCIEKVNGLLQDGIGTALQAAGNAMLDETVLELYSMKYFHSYGEESSFTKLKYEREYLIFGAEKDKSNLLTMVLYLVAVRTLLCMVTILKQPERMAQLERLGAGITGFTGMPVLAAVVKYGVLLLWAVEEALVEVSALLQEKRIAVVGTGTVSFEELFLIDKAAIAKKAKLLPEGKGAAYSDYLALFSLTKKTKDKVYRAMDLIQENIRYRYKDSFRIRNIVTELDFVVKTEVVPLFDTGIFPENSYSIMCVQKKEY